MSTAILLFTKTNSGGTDRVWFYDLKADGRSLDDKRTELLPPAKLGAAPSEPLSDPLRSQAVPEVAPSASHNPAESKPAKAPAIFASRRSRRASASARVSP